MVSAITCVYNYTTATNIILSYMAFFASSGAVDQSLNAVSDDHFQIGAPQIVFLVYIQRWCI